MTSGVIIAIVVFVLVALLAVKGFRIVPQAETMVIERLGKYQRTLQSGINIIWPIIERPRVIHWRFPQSLPDNRKASITKMTPKIDLREQVYDFPRQNVITKDNVNIEIDALLYFQVTDPVKSVYEIANLPDAIQKLTQTTLRNVVGELELDESLVSRDTINTKLRTILDEATDKWGVKVNRVELQDINPPEDVRDQMEKQMRAERDRRAIILQAEGEKRSAVLQAEGIKEAEVRKAEGMKQAAILKAQGDAEARVAVATAEAEAIKLIQDQVSDSGDPINYLVAVRYIETLGQMVEGKDNKVIYMPYEATGVLSSIGGIKDLLGAKDSGGAG